MSPRPKPHLLQPSLLLLLREEPGYGYELMARLKGFGIEDERTTVYRALRALEEAEAVASYWNTGAGRSRHPDSDRSRRTSLIGQRDHATAGGVVVRPGRSFLLV